MVLYELDKPFPIKQYAVPGDNLWPILTADSFDVLQSLTDLTQDEIDAFANASIDVYLFNHNYIPFLVFDFGGKVMSEVAINIKKKTSSGALEYWLESDNSTITFFLLEGRNTHLKCIRYAQLPLMTKVKEILREQSMLPKEVIDRYISDGREMFPSRIMANLAKEKATIPEPINL